MLEFKGEKVATEFPVRYTRSLATPDTELVKDTAAFVLVLPI